MQQSPNLSTTNSITGSLNSVTTPGEYYFGATSTSAPGNGYGLLKVWRENSIAVYQLAHTSDNNLYIRYTGASGSPWSNWRHLAGDDQNVASATQLANTRTIAMTGDGSWSVAFNGTGNATATMTLSNSGVSAGSYGQITVDTKGRVTAARNIQVSDIPGLPWSQIVSGIPTTISGYGITDAVSQNSFNSRVGNAGALSFRNIIINGSGVVNNRGYISGTATSSNNQYTIDMWKVAVSGQSLSWSASGIGVIFTAPAGGVSQIIESPYVVGGTYTLSWTGTATAKINGNAVSNGGTVTLPSNSQVTVTFYGGTFQNPQLELGNYATSFEVRPVTLETMLCMRYYQAGSFHAPGAPYANNNGNTITANTTTFQCMNMLPVAMRATPVISFSDTAGNAGKYSVFAQGATNTFQSMASGNLSATATYIDIDATWTGWGGIWMRCNYSLDAAL